MIDECRLLAAEWEELSSYLGLSSSSINNIKKHRHRHPIVGCLNDALNHWINKNYDTQKFGLPSWRSLLKAVANLNMWMCMDLAAKHQSIPIYHDTILLLKVGTTVIVMLELFPILEANIQHSSFVCILFPFIAYYTHDRETIVNHSVKSVQ